MFINQVNRLTYKDRYVYKSSKFLIYNKLRLIRIHIPKMLKPNEWLKSCAANHSKHQPIINSIDQWYGVCQSRSQMVLLFSPYFLVSIFSAELHMRTERSNSDNSPLPFCLANPSSSVTQEMITGGASLTNDRLTPNGLSEHFTEFTIV